MNCPRCGSFALDNGTCSKLKCAMTTARDRGAAGITFGFQTEPPSGMNLILEAFLSALAAMPPAAREMTMQELENRICLFCGAADPECPCWLTDEELEVPS